MKTNKNILIIAPHPDDEVLGCGGIMAKYASSGNKVYVLIMTRGTPKLYGHERIENVRREAKAAQKIIGVEETRFLDFPAPELDTVSLAEMARAIEKVLIELQINILFLPHNGDIHNDHKVVFNAAMVAARPINNYTVKEIYCFETLSETEWAHPFSNDVFIPNFFVDISAFFHAKIEAMKCFKSQLRDYPSSRSLDALEALSRFRGSTVGYHYAEAFMIIRIIE
ncbi:N-acetyl-alpha-D-glucosaminyl L-malate deacetylase 1 [anaerobic digester metagenome]|jgi:LmbE family N-acetylglucosaminyl deacetylase